MMMKVLFLFVTVQVFRAYASEPFSVSPAARTADVGQTVKLSCEFKNKLEFGRGIFWYKHRADEPPVAIRTTDCQKTGCRATYKKGSGDRTSVLEIRNVSLEDSGFYYCAEIKSYPSLVKGPRLIVGDSSTSRTNMQLFVPSSEVNGSVLLVCLVSGLSSKQIVIYWDISGQITEGWSDPGTRDPDGSYSVRSQVRVPVKTWINGGVSTCIAQFGGAGKKRTMSVSHPNIGPDQDCCLPAAILLGLLIMLVIVIFIWIFKECRSGTHRQSVTREGHSRAAQSQAPIIYASLDFAASSSPLR
ncbi:Ig heavy chain Mem5-like [Hemitrygon akajei]|uniref:Ig heavy chain Mem5-like n=1 Tax=Hemitrygon akajei TaxID=2704970 RepID=UPI003BF9FF1C